MSDGEKLTAFKSHLRRKIASVQELTLCAELNEKDVFVHDELCGLADMITEMERVCSEVTRDLSLREERLEDGNAVLRALQAQNAELTLINATKPELAALHSSTQMQDGLENNNHSHTSSTTTTTSTGNKHHLASEKQHSTKHEHNGVPVIFYVTKDEFADLPHYHKSRMSIEKLNAAIDEISAILNHKYKLMNTKYSKIKDREERELFSRYSEEETEDVKSWTFFTTNNLIKNNALRNDQTGKSMLLVLRYLNRIKMHSDRGINRYIVLPTI